MTLPLTWDQMPLTQAQQTAVQALIAWDAAGGAGTPPLTYSQIKALRTWIASLSALVGPAQEAVRDSYQFYQSQALATYDAANP